MSGQDIEIESDDGNFSAYLALPASGSGPGVLVLQEIFGVNASMRAITDWLAGEGFTALCPDLFWRIEPGIQITDKTEAELNRAFELFGLFNQDTGLQDIRTSLSALRALDACSGKAGAIGYCLGGLLAYRTACHTDSDASVGYYGVSIEDRLAEAAGISAPLMLHIAGADQFVPAAAQARLHDGLGSNPLVTLHDYPGKEHAFARPDGLHYAADSANLANQRTLDFLHRHLD
ncbi:dienelactone hydrolase family protein [uncultured Maricaulis sp.]|uniref:dienelactone hydrolase family protein n=1 Tax=uncultured Maricaulis sp. TaxID=174710 RepID=UPI0030D8D8DD|tara:strand:- start:80630 stop:81328 length:699 start_codon:yes stop_codon:yes gene_type:complete